MSESAVQSRNLCTEGTPEEYLAMAYRLGKAIAGLKGCKEYMTGGQWKIELSEDALVILMEEFSTADSQDLVTAVSDKLPTMEDVSFYLSGGSWKMEFTHASLAGLCLWVQHYSA